MASEPFPIFSIDVPPERRREEQLGTKAKFWFDRDGQQTLFKIGRTNEDWSEKIGAECARLLGLPHAAVDLAVADDRVGIISPTFLQPGDHLVHGNELLLQLDEGYPLAKRYHVRQHTLGAVFGAFDKLSVTAALAERDLSLSAADVFCGYLLLDAWIGNTDRHHENWAVIVRREERILAPTYDHASSLGRNETEPRILARLRGSDRNLTVASYANNSKARSALYSSGVSSRPLSTRDAALEGVRARPGAGGRWLGALAQIDDQTIGELLDRIPGSRITEPHRRFAAAILSFNRQSLLELQS